MLGLNVRDERGFESRSGSRLFPALEMKLFMYILLYAQHFKLVSATDTEQEWP